MAQRGGKRPGAGRKPGKVGAAKLALAEMAKEHAEDALQTLVDIAKFGEGESARVSAAIAILDRAYGKPPQAIQHSGPDGGPIPTVIDVASLSSGTMEELLAARRIAMTDETQPD
jgi:hypothetical protein